MLEDVISPERALKQPILAFIHGLLAALIGSLLAGLIYPQYAGLLAVTFTTLALIHVMHHILIREVAYDETLPRLTRIITHHMPLIILFLMLILGMITGFTMAGVLDGKLLNVQVHEVQQIRMLATGNAISTGRDILMEHFKIILTNNLRVLLVAAILGFAYGYAAVFLLAWNASLVAAAGLIAWRTAQARLHTLPAFLAAYLPHGLIEFAAYFLGAVALSILGIAIARRDWEHPAAIIALLEDAGILFLSALMLVLLGAIVEVWITPLLMS